MATVQVGEMYVEYVPGFWPLSRSKFVISDGRDKIATILAKPFKDWFGKADSFGDLLTKKVFEIGDFRFQAVRIGPTNHFFIWFPGDAIESTKFNVTQEEFEIFRIALQGNI